MPQKKNPDTLELTRAAAGEAMGSLVGVLGTLKGLPRAYNRDLQRGHPDVFETVDRVTEATRVTAGAIDTATWDEDALAAASTEGFTTVTGVADLLAANGMPFRTAHEIVARAVEAVDNRDQLLDELATAADDVMKNDTLESFASQDELAAVLDPRESVERRDSTGGPAPAAVDTHRNGVEQQLAADRETVADYRVDLAEAAETLDREVATYA